MPRDGGMEIVGRRTEEGIKWRVSAPGQGRTYLVLVNANNRTSSAQLDALALLRTQLQGKPASWPSGNPVVFTGVAGSTAARRAFMQDALGIDLRSLPTEAGGADRTTTDVSTHEEAEATRQFLQQIATTDDAVGVMVKSGGLKLPARVRVPAEVSTGRPGVSPQFASRLNTGRNYIGVWELKMSGNVSSGDFTKLERVFEVNHNERLKAGINRFKFFYGASIVYLDVFLNDNDANIAGIVTTQSASERYGNTFKFKYSKEIRNDSLVHTTKVTSSGAGVVCGTCNYTVDVPEMNIEIDLKFIAATAAPSGSE